MTKTNMKDRKLIFFYIENRRGYYFLVIVKWNTGKHKNVFWFGEMKQNYEGWGGGEDFFRFSSVVQFFSWTFPQGMVDNNLGRDSLQNLKIPTIAANHTTEGTIFNIYSYDAVLVEENLINHLSDNELMLYVLHH